MLLGAKKLVTQGAVIEGAQGAKFLIKGRVTVVAFGMRGSTPSLLCRSLGPNSAISCIDSACKTDPHRRRAVNVRGALKALSSDGKGKIATGGLSP